MIKRLSGDYRDMVRHSYEIGNDLCRKEQGELLAELDRLQAILDAVSEALWNGQHDTEDAATIKRVADLVRGDSSYGPSLD